jgi:hypothetical protein
VKGVVKEILTKEGRRRDKETEMKKRIKKGNNEEENMK